ncbi:MAG: winged helix DNA-binding protein [Propionibacteriaceae bacterium]|jgi:DNA-binding MarR family transcriptional regulator|nr:winged helix DNA-binding protein [Propionibacteriaceae bacterium]
MDYEELAAANIRQIMMQFRDGRVLERFYWYAKGEKMILGMLLSRHEPVLPSQISQSLGLSSARTAAALGSLEGKELIVRVHDTIDHRKVYVSLTSAGKELAEAEHDRWIRDGIRIFEEMGSEDAHDLVRLMNRYFELADHVWRQSVE